MICMLYLVNIQLKRELTLILDLPKDHDFLKELPVFKQKVYALAENEASTKPGMKKLLKELSKRKSGNMEENGKP